MARGGIGPDARLSGDDLSLPAKSIRLGAPSNRKKTHTPCPARVARSCRSFNSPAAAAQNGQHVASMSLTVPVDESKSSAHSDVGATQRSNTILHSPHAIRMVSPGFISASVLQEVRGSDQQSRCYYVVAGLTRKIFWKLTLPRVASNGPGIPRSGSFPPGRAAGYYFASVRAFTPSICKMISHSSHPASRPMCVRSPVKAKNAGSNSTVTRSSSLYVNSRATGHAG